MFIFILLCMVATTPSYPFCPNCIHYTKTVNAPNCNLFRTHPLFKDRIDVDSIGKEICSEKGKYFISGGKKGTTNMTLYEQKTTLFQGGRKNKNKK
jgi:hypothetical protein